MSSSSSKSEQAKVVSQKSEQPRRKRSRSSAQKHGKNGPESNVVEPLTIVHYPSSMIFPTVLSSEFPSEPYRSRNKEVKSSIHWGQRKLILSEIQLLTRYTSPEKSYHIVYVGSAPGTHIAFLDEMFDSRHTWELIDPGEFDKEVLSGRPNITLRTEFFTNAVAYDINARRLGECFPSLSMIYKVVTASATKAVPLHEELQSSLGKMDVARCTEKIPSLYEPLLDIPYGIYLLALAGMESSKPLLFISDIRTGSLSMGNFEEHVAENMRAQESWTQILHADYSMLKFRLPYTKIAQSYGGKDTIEQKNLIDDGKVKYLDGEILLPLWTRPTSTEGRLVVMKGAFQRNYDVKKVEDQFFFFNARVREQFHFNHDFEDHPVFNHHFDASAELHALSSYLLWKYPESVNWTLSKKKEMLELISHSITEHLGISFEDAIRRRDAVMLKLAENGKSAHPQGIGATDDCASEQVTSGKNSQWYKNTQKMIQVSQRERSRAVWRSNVDESRFNEPSTIWVTTKMPQ